MKTNLLKSPSFESSQTESSLSSLEHSRSNPHTDAVEEIRFPTDTCQPDLIQPVSDLIPAKLKSLDQWVVWRYIDRDGKETKQPFQPNGKFAKTNDPATWSSFAAVSAKAAEGDFSGIGFVLSMHDGLAGIDLDKCFDPDTNQFTKQEAEEIVRRALELGTYVEISPSGKGVRLFVEGALQRSGKGAGPLSWIEAYDYRSPRYLTVTGDRLPGASSVIQPGQAFLDWLHSTYLKKPESPVNLRQGTLPEHPVCPEYSDDVLIYKIRVSQSDGPRFSELFDNAKLINHETGEVNEDHSAADFALCGILARWSERNTNQIDSIFRLSALMREKWDERHSSDGRTYGAMTMQNAINGCTQTRKEWQEARRQADVSFIAESLAGADPAIITSTEFASALYRVSLNDQLALMRWEKQGAFKSAKLNKKEVQLILKEGARIYEVARNNLPEPVDADANIDADIEAAIKELNEKFCVAWMGGNLNVMRYVVSEEHVNGGFVPTSKSDMQAWYANKRIEIPDPANDRTIRIDPVTRWWASKDRAEYDGVEFYPGQERVITKSDKQLLNLWGGWAIEPQEGDISPFLELLLRVVCSGNTAKMECALDWMAHLFQQPACLPSTALLFRGGQGWGKNSVIDTLAKPLGSSFLQVSTPKQLTGDFNAHMANKLLIHGAESVWGGEKSKVGSLKAMITDEHQAVEHKGRDVFQVKNFKRLILSSNEKWPIPMDLDDRRFLVFSNTKVWGTGDSFWSEFRRWRGDHSEWEGAARLFGFLLDRDISNFKPWAKPAEFTDGWDLKIKNSDAVTQWWYAVLRDGDENALTCLVDTMFGKNKTEIYGSWEKGAGSQIALRRQDLWAAFSSWVRTSGTRNNSHEQDRKSDLKHLCPSMQEKQLKVANKSPCFVFPDLEKCRLEFADAIGASVDEVFPGSADIAALHEDEEAAFARNRPPKSLFKAPIPGLEQQ